MKKQSNCSKFNDILSIIITASILVLLVISMLEDQPKGKVAYGVKLESSINK